ncbi:hypothetical protein GCM10023190_21560 [Enteractinococcus fodinae]|uniref:Uncharacterized membrane protein (DUF485 family) n=1 Tax=Enteractinococcus fodinae TaxID=684663 RepID=A0ABU2B3B5_9MICC|nr:hypothetical protein [Enteractinococcus fodinae]MDR7348085.1 uncharacterized membrane protein (DUF485 family) [Enteractinococcus fodinae]
MTPQYQDDEDFELDLIREPEPPAEVPESIRAMRARRVPVEMPTGLPSVQEVLHNPADRARQHQQPAIQQTVRRLMRTQLRLAVSLMAWFIGVVVVGNLAFHFSPALAATRVIGVPVEWLFPVVIVIPLLIFLGWFYVGRATAQEQQVHYDQPQAAHS